MPKHMKTAHGIKGGTVLEGANQKGSAPRRPTKPKTGSEHRPFRNAKPSGNDPGKLYGATKKVRGRSTRF